MHLTYLFRKPQEFILGVHAVPIRAVIAAAVVQVARVDAMM